jgi:hypothetical protein
MTATYVTGDVFACLAATPTASVDLLITSPPFLALRSYLPADHPDKAHEIGQEPNPAAFIDTLLALTAEWRRVLTPHGSIAVELGDTYAGSGGAGGDYAEDGFREGQGVFRQVRTDGWPEAKSACLIPELYRVALAYGVNPLTAQPSPAGRWRVRNTVRWCRPNPPVGALGDKFRPATSDMVIACVDTPAGQRRYFDLDAVREPFMGHGSTEGSERSSPNEEGTKRNWSKGLQERRNTHAGAPPLDWWQVSTEPYAGSHYATWPRKLLERPIKAMVPPKVCTVCGEPSRRIVDVAYTPHGDPDHQNGEDRASQGDHKTINGSAGMFTHGRATKTTTTLGWTDCDHDAWRPGHVLDPFGGSGTTLAVATGHGHHATGFDLDERNVDLARERVGPMFFTALTLAEYQAMHRTEEAS